MCIHVHQSICTMRLYIALISSWADCKLAAFQEDACWQAFRVFDRDGNGTISQKELHPQRVSHTLMQDKPYVLCRNLPDVRAAHLYLPRLAEVLASDDVAGKFHKARMGSLKVMWYTRNKVKDQESYPHLSATTCFPCMIQWTCGHETACWLPTGSGCGLPQEIHLVSASPVDVMSERHFWVQANRQLLIAKDLMKMVDTNGDGEIDFQEFMQMMRTPILHNITVLIFVAVKDCRFIRG